MGLARVDGRTVEIKNALAGEKARVRINKIRKNRAEGTILSILEPVVERAEPICPHDSDCGGCAFLRIPYDIQLKQKEREVLKLLEQSGIKGFSYGGIAESPLMYAYRNKMEFTFGNLEKGGEMTLGLHHTGKFYSVITTDRCRIVDEDFNMVLKATLAFFKERGIPHYNKLNHEGYLRHLVIRKSFRRKELLVNLVTTSQMEYDLSPFVERLLELNTGSKIAGVLHTRNDSMGDAVIGEKYDILYGRDYIVEEILGLTFEISAFSFFQTNSLAAEVLYSTVREYLGDTGGKVVYDLYCGTGVIAQVAAEGAKHVYGVELVEDAVMAARKNAAANGIRNVTFIAGDVGEKLREIEEKPDIVIVDPPRPGVSSKALRQIIDCRVPTIVYVSCNPKSLAENLKELAAAGYQAQRVKLVDMFPHTPHVETVVLMSKVKNQV